MPSVPSISPSRRAKYSKTTVCSLELAVDGHQSVLKTKKTNKTNSLPLPGRAKRHLFFPFVLPGSSNHVTDGTRAPPKRAEGPCQKCSASWVKVTRPFVGTVLLVRLYRSTSRHLKGVCGGTNFTPAKGRIGIVPSQNPGDILHRPAPTYQSTTNR